MNEVTFEHQGINYRAKPRPDLREDGSVRWDIEYDANGQWGPRGHFLERDGKYIQGGLTFDSPYMALRNRVLNH